MPDPVTYVNVSQRIAMARHARCGGDAWVPPPHGWQDIVRRSWPHVWSLSPVRVPDGWCDLLMAFSEHVSEYGGRLHDAFENSGSGGLIVQRIYDPDEMLDVVLGYQQASLSICRVCGEEGDVRLHESKPTWVLCDDHT